MDGNDEDSLSQTAISPAQMQVKGCERIPVAYDESEVAGVGDEQGLKVGDQMKRCGFCLLFLTLTFFLFASVSVSVSLSLSLSVSYFYGGWLY